MTLANRRLLAASFMAAVFTGCASMMIGSQPWFEQHDYGQKALTKRAAADLSCDAPALAFFCVGAGGDGCTSVAVKGCEKTATYEFVSDRWIMNNAAASPPQ